MKLQLHLISLSLFLLLSIFLQEGQAKKTAEINEAAKKAEKEDKEAAKKLEKIAMCAVKCDADNAKESDVACWENGYAYKNKCMLKCRGEVEPAKSRDGCRKKEEEKKEEKPASVDVEDDDPDFNPEDYNFSTYDLESYMGGNNSTDTDEGTPAEAEAEK